MKITTLFHQFQICNLSNIEININLRWLGIISTPILCLIINSWLFVWIFLELNTICLCSLIRLKDKQKTFSRSEIAIKYFIIQSVSSSILVLGLLVRKENNNTIFLILRIIAIMIKLAASPFHQWFISVTKNSKLTNNITLITWQKLAPTYFLIFLLKNIIMIFLVLSAFVGSISQINKKLIIEIIAFSSIFNLRWMIVRIIVSMKIFFLFCLIYWTSVLIIMFAIKNILKINTQIEKISSNKVIMLMILGNLAGIPPILGFLAKWMVFTENLKTGLLTVTTVLLISSAINFYIYLRMAPQIFNEKISQTKTSSNIKFRIIAAIIMTPIFIILVYRACLNKGLFW